MGKLLGFGGSLAVALFAAAFVIANSASSGTTIKTVRQHGVDPTAPALQASAVEAQFSGSVAPLKVIVVHHKPKPASTPATSPASAGGDAAVSSSAVSSNTGASSVSPAPA